MRMWLETYVDAYVNSVQKIELDEDDILEFEFQSLGYDNGSETWTTSASIGDTEFTIDMWPNEDKRTVTIEYDYVGAEERYRRVIAAVEEVQFELDKIYDNLVKELKG